MLYWSQITYSHIYDNFVFDVFLLIICGWLLDNYGLCEILNQLIFIKSMGLYYIIISKEKKIWHY